MSNKLSSKPSKRDRPRSTDKSAKSKKRDGGTPDKMSSPVGSAVHIQDEICTGPSIGKVISGDDIDSLAINVDELKKVHPPKKPPGPKPSKTIVVRKTRLKQSLEQNHPVGKSMTVARPAPPDAPLVSTPLVGTTGPLFDEDGQVLTHTILGSWEDFQNEAIKRGDIENLPPFSGFKFGAGKVRPTTKSKNKEKTFSSHVWQTRINESNALTNWQRQMIQRKRQQQHLSDVLSTPTDMLVMNQSEEYRETQEKRYAIDRSIPSMDYGKGYRVGSEFWKQMEQIGDDETGINMTLTQTERGYPPAVEHIGKPISIKNEMGIEWSSTHRIATVHYPWQKSSYLQERTKQLQNVLHELDSHQPYIDELAVIGTNQPQHTSKFDMMSVVQEEEESEMLDESMPERPGDPLASIADVIPQPIFGPSLSIGGHTAQWTGPRGQGITGQVGVACRVIFEADVGDRVTSYLNICNDGTTAIYFSWKKIPHANVLGTKLAGQTQRFYFDTKSGVILPGDTLNFPFIFKSPNAGIFTETWELMTKPILCGGAPIRITLRGVAVEDDIYEDARQQIEQELAHREAVETATRILNEILDGVRTPERARSPVDAYITEEEIFGRANEGMYFQDEVVQELKQIYAQLEEEEEWDLSLHSLQQKIMSVEDGDQRDSLLQTLNSCISTLSFPPMTPVKHAMYAAGYQLLCEMVDSIVGQANMIRGILGLPERELVEDTSQDEVTQRLRKGTTSETKADARKGDKKDKKAPKISETSPEPCEDSCFEPEQGLFDRPTSTQRSKLSAKKSGRGTSTPSSQSKSALSETAVERTGTPVSVDGSAVDNAADPVLEAKYREKLFTQMIDELLRMFARENFGGDKYYPVFHGETETTKPLALIIKRSRSIWKRPFSKLEMTILAGLEKYVENHNKEAHLEDVKSKIIQEEVLEKEKNAPAACHREIDLEAGEVAGFTLQLDDDLGDLQLGKLSQEYISDPDLCDILANTALDPNKMNRLKDQKLLLITSVIYSERFDVQGDRKHKVDVGADVEPPTQIAKLLKTKMVGHYKETVIPPGVATRNVRGPILFKCCRVNYNEETKRLEIPPGEFIGKGTARGGGDDEENAIGDEVDTDETDLPDYFTDEDIKKLDTITREVLMAESSRERRKTRASKYLQWFEKVLITNQWKFKIEEPLTREDCKFLRSIFVPSFPNQTILDLTSLSKEDIQGYGIVLKVLDDLPPEQWTELEMTLAATEN